jgi:hypothetical protein
MGCTESLPDKSAFERAHHGNPKVANLGSSVAGAAPSTQGSIQLVVREKMFSWSGDTFKIKTRAGLPYNGLQIKGKAFSLRDRMTMTRTNRSLCVYENSIL